MGGGASITELSAIDLGDLTRKLGKHYEVASKEIVDSGITGTILFSAVHDNEEQFKSFVAENLSITKPIHQTVLFTNYTELLNHDGVNAKSVPVPFEIQEILQRAPRQILTDLFQIQGIKLDPENVAGAVDEIAAAIHASIGEGTTCDGINSFHCFIGYRVLADKIIAESLFDKLTVKGFMPFLDKFKLKNGLPWKDGFLQGLKGSKCFVSVISAGALSLCRDKSRNHTWDNYLLEIETALHYKQASGNPAYVIPIHVGEMVTVEGRTMLCKFGDFAGSLYADTIEGSASVPSLDAPEKAHTVELKVPSSDGPPMGGTEDDMVHDNAVPTTTKNKTKPTKSGAASPSDGKDATSYWKKGSPGRQRMDAIIDEERAKIQEKAKQLVIEMHAVVES